jgi:hypothetical protein
MTSEKSYLNSVDNYDSFLRPKYGRRHFLLLSWVYFFGIEIIFINIYNVGAVDQAVKVSIN